jgi:hypothetical protein
LHSALDTDAGRLTLTFDDLDEVASYVEAARSQNGFLVELASELARGREVAVGASDIAGH